MLRDKRVQHSVLSLLAWSVFLSVGYAQDDRLDKQAIENQLDSTTTVLYVDQPLPRVLADIAKRHALSIKMDDRVAKANPESPRLPVNIDLRGVSLRSSLRLLLRAHDLEYINEGNRLLVTTREYAETVHRENRYAIPTTIATDGDAFVAAINETILLDQSMGAARVDGNQLVVKAPRAVHATISTLVDQFQPARDTTKVAASVQATTAQAQIDQFLQQPADMNYVLTPLMDAIQQISLKHGIPIVIDLNTLEQAGIGPDVPVTFELKGVDMDRSLRFLLNSCNLSYIVKDEIVQVTTRELADSYREVVVHTFPSAVEPHMAKLRELYIKRVPTAWNGGDNRFATFKHHFVVYGTRPVQIATGRFVDHATQSFNKATVLNN